MNPLHAFEVVTVIKEKMDTPVNFFLCVSFYMLFAYHDLMSRS